eukprot:TRINITY_DN50229_c0_g1_i1.p1 TRINITY_DN50229_c0_g1~~TRINITY_DN50229_c0_g1_i1.p1  ORF type:complete len:620 (+),score=119.02 TRINITY_DN50229_c0_g1_i1:84-1862(+)
MARGDVALPFLALLQVWLVVTCLSSVVSALDATSCENEAHDGSCQQAVKASGLLQFAASKTAALLSSAVGGSEETGGEDSRTRPLCAVKGNRCFDLQLPVQEALEASMVRTSSAEGHPRQTAEIVVVRFGEDVRWLDAFPHVNTTLFNRGGPDALLPQSRANLKVIAQANSGREDSGMLKYIVHHYDNLPDRVIFLQGWPFVHCAGLTEAVKFALLSPEPLVPIARNFYKYSMAEERMGYELSDANPDVAEGKLEFRRLCQLILNKPCPETMWVTEGAQLAVDRERIHKVPRWAYERALKFGEGWHAKLRGLVLEGLWGTLWAGSTWEPRESIRRSQSASAAAGTRARSAPSSLLQLASKPSDALGADISAAVAALAEAEGSYCLMEGEDDSLLWSCEERMAFCELQHAAAGTRQPAFSQQRERFWLPESGDGSGESALLQQKKTMVAQIGIPLLPGPAVFLHVDNASRILLSNVSKPRSARQQWRVAVADAATGNVSLAWLGDDAESLQYLACDIESGKAFLSEREVFWDATPAADGYLFLRRGDGDALHAGPHAGVGSELLCVPPSPDSRTFRSTISFAVIPRHMQVRSL